MSIYASMRTSVSGMNAQSSRLGTIADNIANASTVGYKRADSQFTSLVRERPGELSRYQSGGVTARVRQNVGQQGTLEFTSQATDLAVQGDGFFVVESPAGERVLTRAGSFVPDRDGRLVNAAGFALLGQPAGAAPGNGGELVPVDLAATALQATASSEGRVVVNLDAAAPVIAPAERPSNNAAASQSSGRTSVLAFGAKGREQLLDVHFARTGPDTYEVAAFDRAAASDPGPFPYAGGPGAHPLAVATLRFDPVTGRIDPGGAQSIAVPVPDPDVAPADWTTVELDLSLASHLSADFSVRELAIDGHGPAAISRVEIARDGMLRAVYETGVARELYEIPLATVTSPDRLNALPGNVFSESAQSGLVVVGRAETGAAGTIVAGALEASNVDIAAELTAMIQSQRNFTANSKVFQTGSELMDVIVNLKR